jgi:hypothetical protein
MEKNAKLAILKFAVIYFLRKTIITFYLPNNIFTQNNFCSDCHSNFFRKVVVYISFYTFFPVVKDVIPVNEEKILKSLGYVTSNFVATNDENFKVLKDMIGFYLRYKKNRNRK